MEFRAQFLAGIMGYAIWSGVSLLFIERVFHYVGAVRGWTRAEMWVLLGTFIILESICTGCSGPNMFRFSTAVRDGTLDMALTKPVSTQFFVSTRYMDMNGLMNSLIGVALLVVGLRRVGHTPELQQWAAWLVLLRVRPGHGLQHLVLLRDVERVGREAGSHRGRVRPHDADGTLSVANLSGAFAGDAHVCVARGVSHHVPGTGPAGTRDRCERCP
jgi:hypothetical protein